LLFHPLLARVGRHSCQAHPPTLQVNEKQNIVSNQPCELQAVEDDCLTGGGK
jgi:hypothetical protein